jgi:hypothetical protein
MRLTTPTADGFTLLTVQTELSTEVSDQWSDLAGEDEQRLYSPLRRQLACLPDLEAAALTRMDGLLGVIAVGQGGLFTLTPKGEGFVITRRQLGGEVLIALEEHEEQFEGRPTNARLWTLIWPNGDRVTFVSHINRHRRWHSAGPDEAERVGWAIAAQIGWKSAHSSVSVS